MHGLRRRMTARDHTEQHRAATPLELLFDLTFVVAIAQVALQLAHAIEDGHAAEALLPYVMVFFAIWWAWMNFTWFASAYDTDDVLFRVFTLVQMVGVLVLAAGVPTAFNDGNFTAPIVGYVIMRVGLVGHWVRAAIEHPEGRVTAVRYAVGITAVQLIWVARLAIPGGDAVWVFFAIGILDLAVPIWAERTGRTSWHPHHIAERYGLFTIIVLGEGVLAATMAVQSALDAGGVSVELVTIAVAGLTLIFTLWWAYFSEPAGIALAENRDRSFIWGYGHFGIFAALAALGAGLEVSVATANDHGADADHPLAPHVVAAAVAIPVAIFLVLLWLVHAPLVREAVIRPAAVVITAAAVLAVPFAADGIGIPLSIVAITLVCVALLVFALIDGRHRLRAALGHVDARA